MFSHCCKAKQSIVGEDPISSASDEIFMFQFFFAAGGLTQSQEDEAGSMAWRFLETTLSTRDAIIC